MSWNPAEQIEDLASKKLKSRLGLKKELRTLPSYLQEREEILNLSNGMYDGASGLIILTDRRVCFLSAGMAKSRFEDFQYGRISSVQHSGGMLFGELIIFASGNKAVLQQMAKDRAKEIGDYIRDRISNPREATHVDEPQRKDAFDKLRKLGELRDAGVITEEDFEAKKRELLADI